MDIKSGVKADGFPKRTFRPLPKSFTPEPIAFTPDLIFII